MNISREPHVQEDKITTMQFLLNFYECNNIAEHTFENNVMIKVKKSETCKS